MSKNNNIKGDALDARMIGWNLEFYFIAGNRIARRHGWKRCCRIDPNYRFAATHDSTQSVGSLGAEVAYIWDKADRLARIYDAVAVADDVEKDYGNGIYSNAGYDNVYRVLKRVDIRAGNDQHERYRWIGGKRDRDIARCVGHRIRKTTSLVNRNARVLDRQAARHHVHVDGNRPDRDQRREIDRRSHNRRSPRQHLGAADERRGKILVSRIVGAAELRIHAVFSKGMRCSELI